MLAANWLAGIARRVGPPAPGNSARGRASPVSGIMVAIILGMVVANTVGVPGVFAPGLQFGIKKVLRLGIILVGIKLSFLDVIKLGAYGIPVVLALDRRGPRRLTHALGRAGAA